MNINNQSQLVGDRSRLAQDASRTQQATSNSDPVKQAGIAQATVRVVQEALGKTAAATVSPPPSAQLSIESAKIGKSSSAEKLRDDEDLDVSKLDELKAKIADGSFQIDLGLLARQIVEHSAQQVGGKRGR